MSPAVSDALHALGRMVPIAALVPSALNPRKRFDEHSLADLQANIQKRGEVIVPLIVRPLAAGRFEIVDGERRYRAASRIGSIAELPAILREDLTDSDVLEIQLLSAIQRQELTPLEEAAGYRALIDANPARYSAAYIGDRIGRSEKFVVDRMRLLDLIPVLRQLLDAERILVGHADLLARLKPDDQERALEPPDRYNRSEGLWQNEHDRLRLDDDEDDEPTAKNLFRGLKPVTVKELESWIAHHVRFDVEHMAAAAPLDFGPVKEEVDAARAQPGRGRKVISITDQYRVDDDAKDATERTYGQQSWRRADGREDSKTCDHSVLGVFVAGPGYGSTLRVCVNRDKCAVHFAAEIKEREKNAKLRSQGKSGQAAKNEQRSAKKAESSWERQERERKAQQKIWQAIAKPLIADAVEQVRHVKALTPQQAKAVLDADFYGFHSARKFLGADWFKTPAAAILVTMVDDEDDYGGSFDRYVKETATPLGLDIKRLEAIRDKHQPVAAAPPLPKPSPAVKKTPKPSPAKKTAAAKAAKKRKQ